MEPPLEETLYQAILAQDQDTVSQVLLKGANPNRTISHGRTCLGEAAIIGNIDIFKLLITSSQTSSAQQKVSSYNINTRKRQVKCQKRKLRHQGQCEETIAKCKNLNDRTHRDTNFGQFETIEILDNNTRVDRNQESILPGGKPGHLKSLPITERNQGYFVFVHNESSSSDESKIGSLISPLSPSSQTCSPQADLEWDEEIGNVAPATTEDDTCSSIYKWYAGILESTGAAIASASIFTHGINQQDVSMKTALYYAAEYNHLAVVTLLIEAGCRLDTTSGNGFTPLHIAVIKNHSEIVQILLKAGSQVNYPTHVEMTALHLAASGGFLDVVKVLIKHGAYLEARDIDERTALYLAASKGHEDVVRYLVAAGANVNGEEISGYTPLCEAVWQSYPVILEILLKAGARVTHSHRLLHKAVAQRQEEIVKLLANFGGGVNVRNDYGDTPLLLAAKLLRPEIARILLSNGANPNSWNTITGENALHLAVERDMDNIHFEELLKCLLDYKIDLNATALTGDTALSRALLLRRDHAAALLIRHGADVNNCDLMSCGLDNLSLASKRRTINMAAMVLKAGHYVIMPDPSAAVPVPGSTEYWLYWACKQPLTLSDLCRIKIRNIGKGIVLHRFISSLPLPKSLKRYLMMEDEG